MIPEIGLTLFQIPNTLQSPNTNDQKDLFEILDFGPWDLFGI